MSDDNDDGIIDDFNPVLLAQREAIALETLQQLIKNISIRELVSKDKAFCMLMKQKKVNCKERTEVHEYLWETGISEADVLQRTDDFMSYVASHLIGK